MSHYGDKRYWEQRYTQAVQLQGTFEWYVPYTTPDGNTTPLRDAVLSLLPADKTASILFVGCGISRMPEQLYDDGYQNIVCVDWSETCIQFMNRRKLNQLPDPSQAAAEAAQRAASSANLKSDASSPPAPHDGQRRGTQTVLPHRDIAYYCCDCGNLTERYPRGSFDVVIDKGMIDAAFCGDDLTKQREHVGHVATEIFKVLNPAGRFIMVSHTGGTDGIRSTLFDNPTTPWASEIGKYPLDRVGAGAAAGTEGAAVVAIPTMQQRQYFCFCLYKEAADGRPLPNDGAGHDSKASSASDPVPQQRQSVAFSMDSQK